MMKSLDLILHDSLFAYASDGFYNWFLKVLLKRVMHANFLMEYEAMRNFMIF